MNAKTACPSLATLLYSTVMLSKSTVTVALLNEEVSSFKKNLDNLLFARSQLCYEKTKIDEKNKRFEKCFYLSEMKALGC